MHIRCSAKVGREQFGGPPGQVAGIGWDRAGRAATDPDPQPVTRAGHYLVNQVKALRALGVTKIETLAAGNPDSVIFNGFYTWARFGYEGRIKAATFRKFPPEIRAAMAKKSPRRCGSAICAARQNLPTSSRPKRSSVF